MGKNQQHKARQQARVHQADPVEGEHGGSGVDGVDASFHSAQWHEARVAALQVERPSWESWRLKQKEDEMKERAVLDEQEKAMKEYKALLEADRARRLEGSKDSKHDSSRRKKRREERSSTTLRHKHRKRSRDSKHDRRRGRASDSSSSDGEGGGHKDNRLRTKRTHQEALTTSGGPVKLSEYLNS